MMIYLEPPTEVEVLEPVALFDGDAFWRHHCPRVKPPLMQKSTYSVAGWCRGSGAAETSEPTSERAIELP